MITTQHVYKYFGTQAALQDVSFDINPGEIVGFLGPNGAGKTTLMRVLTTYLPASRGKVFIAGIDIDREPLKVCSKIGYLSETPPLYYHLTVAEYLLFAAQLKDVPAHDQRRRLETVLAQCQLENVRSTLIQHLSRGFKQRVGIAQALIHDPTVLILDEPTNGLDPVQILQVRHLIQ
ncbi:MAG: ABC transporter ATP-binding protein, partial [Candidatus Omnitrophota bacterium]|nr:ABC transporter ATP-binding protein [Candidatus Omnitrophota bacterium]